AYGLQGPPAGRRWVVWRNILGGHAAPGAACLPPCIHASGDGRGAGVFGPCSDRHAFGSGCFGAEIQWRLTAIFGFARMPADSRKVLVRCDTCTPTVPIDRFFCWFGALLVREPHPFPGIAEP